MENQLEELFMCKNCKEHKPRNKYQKDCKLFKNCLTCRNKKYYKKEYFKTYYEQHTDEIKGQAMLFYETKKKLLHPLKRGRPKKDQNLEEKIV